MGSDNSWRRFDKDDVNANRQLDQAPEPASQNGSDAGAAVVAVANVVTTPAVHGFSREFDILDVIADVDIDDDDDIELFSVDEHESEAPKNKPQYEEESPAKDDTNEQPMDDDESWQDPDLSMPWGGVAGQAGPSQKASTKLYDQFDDDSVPAPPARRTIEAEPEPKPEATLGDPLLQTPAPVKILLTAPPTKEQIAVGQQAQAAYEQSLKDMAKRDADAKAEKQAAIDRANKLEETNLNMERYRRLSGIERTVTGETKACSVFTPGDMVLPVIHETAARIADRADAYRRETGELGHVDSLDLFNRNTVKSSGITLVQGFIDGKVEAAGPALVSKVSELAGNSRRRIALPWSKDDPAIANNRAWDIINEAARSVARGASAVAHKDLFTNITILPNGEVVHKHPDHPEKFIMEHDFDELVAALEITKEDWYKQNQIDCGFFIPLEKHPEHIDPVDKIVEAAGGPKGGLIMNLNEYGQGSFLALISTNSVTTTDQKSKGGYLVFVHNPLIPVHNLKAIKESSGAHGFNLRNTRPMPAMAQEAVIQLGVNVWHIGSDGYPWVVGIFKGQRKGPFADPRQTLREGHQLVVEDFERRTLLLQGAQNVISDFDEKVSEFISHVSAASAAEIDNDTAATKDRMHAIARSVIKSIGLTPEDLRKILESPETPELEVQKRVIEAGDSKNSDDSDAGAEDLRLF